MPAANMMSILTERMLKDGMVMQVHSAPSTTEKRQITRNRTSYSCQICRRRKIKCDKAHPSCGGCLKSGDVCVYGKAEQSPPSTTDGQNLQPSRKRGSVMSSDVAASTQARLATAPGNVIIHGLEQQLSRLADLVESLRQESPQSNGSQTTPDSFAGQRESVESARNQHAQSTPSGVISDVLVQKAGELSQSLADLDIAKSAATYRTNGREKFWSHLAEELKQLQYLIRGSPALPTEQSLTEAMGIDHTDCNRPRDNPDPDALIDEPIDMHIFQPVPPDPIDNDCLPCYVRSGDKSTLLMPRRLGSLNPDASQIDLTAMLPTEAQSHVLFRAWMTGIYPALPVFPMRITYKRYLRFWKWRRQLDGDPENNPESVDLYIIPVLFAIWYTGALSLSTRAFQRLFPNVTRAELCANYHDECIRMLAMVSFPYHNQPYLLAALVLLQSVPCAEEEPLQSSGYINLSVRLAQTLGMHREPTLLELNPFDAETRRRTWWQIIQLDTSLAISSGFPTSTSDSTADARQISQVKEMFIGSAEEQALLELDINGSSKIEPIDDPVGSSISIASVGALVSRTYSSVAVATRKIVTMHMRTKPVDVKDLQEMNEIIAATEVEVRNVMNNIPSRGVPELGFTPTESTSRFPAHADCDPMLETEPTDAEVTFHTGILTEDLPPALGRFHRQRTAAFHKFARIWLSMMCDKMHCIAYAPFLKNLNSKLWGGGRQCALHHCCAFFRKFLSLANDPALEPFRWNWPGTAQPMHAAIILLVDLYERPHSVEAARSRSLIDEVFSLSAPINGIVGCPFGNTSQRPFREGGGDAWEMLRNLRATAWRKAGLDPDVLWTEEQQVLVGLAKPLTMEQKVARSMREDTLYDNSTPETGDQSAINSALQGMFNEMTSETAYRTMVGNVQMPEPSPRNPIRLPGQQPMPFPLLRQPKGQLSTHGPGTSAHIEANRYNGALPEELQDTNTGYDKIPGGPQSLLGLHLASSNNTSDGSDLQSNGSSAESPGFTHHMVEAIRSINARNQLPSDDASKITNQYQNRAHQPQFSQATEPVHADSDSMDFEFDWNAWDAVFNPYSGYYTDLLGEIPPSQKQDSPNDIYFILLDSTFNPYLFSIAFNLSFNLHPILNSWPKACTSAGTQLTFISTPTFGRKAMPTNKDENTSPSAQGHPTLRPRKSFAACTQGEIVTILAGPSEATFKIHEDLLTDRFEFFKKAVARDIAEAQTSEIKLHTVDVEVFTIIAEWLYTGVLPDDDGVIPTVYSKFWVAIDMMCVLDKDVCDQVVEKVRYYFRVHRKDQSMSLDEFMKYVLDKQMREKHTQSVPKSFAEKSEQSPVCAVQLLRSNKTLATVISRCVIHLSTQQLKLLRVCLVCLLATAGRTFDKMAPAEVETGKKTAPEDKSTKSPIKADSKISQGPIATIHVGKGTNGDTFHLHVHLLQSKSKFFRTTFDSDFEENNRKEVILPEHDPAAFEIFVNWLYEGSLPEGHSSSALIGVWILADKLMCTDLQDDAMDALRRFHNGGLLYFGELRQLEEAKLDESKVMQYMLREGARRLATNWQNNKKFILESRLLSLDPTLVVRLMTEMHMYYQNPNRQIPYNMVKCEWHVHELDESSQQACQARRSKKRKHSEI